MTAEERIAELEAMCERLAEAVKPLANDYFSNVDEANLNHCLVHYDKTAYDTCVFFEDVFKAKQAIDEYRKFKEGK